ncbi:hypothetical protein TNCT_194501 [Trichonephila clavata]|uniref:DUF4817 domain-containing protein n=1 Tax=Trichonephila clavata TaxID=2740835 RepID=A0A8X6HSZ2_TRICU|nr:hypothetical protein TNCT_194501 [Trichonephila clavata]
MVYLLEQRIFVLEFHHLDHSFAATRRSFQRKFIVRNGLTNSTIKALFEKLQRIGNVNDDRAENAGHPIVTIHKP